MKTASKQSFSMTNNSNLPFSYMNNPQIMKIVNDSYGTLNKKFNGGQIPSPIGVPVTSGNYHYMLSGNQFVPVPMEMFLKEPQLEQKFNTGSARTELNKPVIKETSQSTFSNVKFKGDSAMLMPLPIPLRNKNENLHSNYTPLPSTNINFDDLPKISQQSDMNGNEKKTYRVKNIFCTGTIERLLRWNRSLEDVFCIYETIAPIVSLQEGRIKNQKIMLLRDKKGPILQVHYYTSTHIDINDFHIGQCLRCVGRMIGFNVLSAESIREATENEIATLSRLSYVCDYSVTHNLNKS